jgi:preprotein translocase subunit YajC
MTILMLVAVAAAFYFLMIRPQQKRAKEQKEHMAALAVGSRIMTVHGIFGNIVELGDRQAIIELSPGVEMTILKQAISNQPVEDEFEYDDDAEAVAEQEDLDSGPSADEIVAAAERALQESASDSEADAGADPAPADKEAAEEPADEDEKK